MLGANNKKLEIVQTTLIIYTHCKWRDARMDKPPFLLNGHYMLRRKVAMVTLIRGLKVGLKWCT